MKLNVPTEFKNYTYYGRGPFENYSDRNTAANIDVYKTTVDTIDGENKYVKPQENGNRTDVRWAAVTNDEGLGFMVAAEKDMSSSVSRYEDEDMNDVRHMYQVKKSDHIVLNVDQVQRGLGGAACGPAPLDQYTLKKGQTYSHTFRIVPVATNDVDTLMEESNRDTQSSLPVKSILLDGKEIAGFDVNKDNYEINLLKGSYTKLPKISVVTTDDKVVVEDFKQPESLPAVVTIKAKSGYGIEKTYTITIKEVDEMYASDMPWSLDQGGYFANSRDVCDSNPISLYVNGVKTNYTKGIGAHAPSKVGIDISGKGYTNLRATIGINSNQTNTAEGYAQVIFKVYGDGEEIYNSGVMKALKSKDMDVDVKGYNNIILEVDPDGADYNDHASWANLKFVVEKTEEEVNKEGLQTSVDEYSKYEEADYTPETWVGFKAALDEAVAVLEDDNVTQQQVDDAKIALETAAGLLEKVVIVEDTDKTMLEIAIGVADEITEKDLANVVPAVVKEFKAALADAKDILANAKATQEQIDKAFDRLASAMQYLEFVKGDKKVLTAFINQVSNLDESKYSASTWTGFKAALDAANGVLDDENALLDDVNEAYTKLVTAFLNLRKIPNKDELNDLIGKAEGLNSVNYTESSWSAMQAELANAKAVFANPDATEAEVLAAKDALTKAVAGLVMKPGNGETAKPGDNTAIKTGDNNNMAQLGAMLGLAGVATVLIKRKKEEK